MILYVHSMYDQVVADEIRFDWNDANIGHLARHNVNPEEAEQALRNGPVEIEYQDIGGEKRYVDIGRTNRGRFLTLVATEREGAVRVITGWDSTAEEEAEYWRGV